MDFSRIGPICGCLSSVVFTICWVASAMLWDDWTLGTHALSDLGMCGVDSAEITFNIGCLLTGFLVLFPGLHLAEQNNRLFRISGYAAIICSVACAAIGVVTEDYGIMHEVTASTYAIFAAVFIISSAAGDYTIGKKMLTAVAAVMLATSGILCIVQPFAVFEPVAVSCILIWTFIQSALMLHLSMKESE
ncbi:MAG: DUF998 domain-containing protein [Candidatus Methanomethylophilaceae archaeon]|nr:DUF998 domain-containing protein [Candidatus Methanomethylophilaceae archaeon]